MAAMKPTRGAFLLACALATSAIGCGVRRPDPSLAARAMVLAAADAIGRHDAAALARFVLAPALRPRGDHAAVFVSDERPLAEQIARLRSAAHGSATAFARVRLRGPLEVEVALSLEEDGWRVDPDTLGLRVATPAAAIEQLITALERMTSDPALAILTGPLQGTLLRATRERVDGLRAVLAWVGRQSDARLFLHVSYGEGLFVDLRLEGGAWRVDDFN